MIVTRFLAVGSVGTVLLASVIVPATADVPGPPDVLERATALLRGEIPEEPPPADDLIVWLGESCADMQLYVRLHEDDLGYTKKVAVFTEDTPSCGQVAEPIERIRDPGLLGGLAQEGLLASSNYVHTSHTLQDIVRIDVAWFRTSYERGWDGNKAWYVLDPIEANNQIAWLDGGPGWWPTKQPPYFYYHNMACPNPGPAYPGMNCASVLSIADGNFHTDFLHCNQINQDIRLATYVTSRKDGGRTVEFIKYGSCPGVFSATGHTTTNYPGAYGGQTVGALYTCVTGAHETPPAQTPCHSGSATL